MQLKINEKTFPLLSSIAQQELLAGHSREVVTLKLEATYQEAVDNFVQGAVFTIIEEVTGEDGSTTTVEHYHDDYPTPGSITDHRDGTVTVKMGAANTREQDLEDKAAEAEATVFAVVGAPVSDVAAARAVVEAGAATLSDGEAAKVPYMSKKWVVGETVEPGDRRYYEPTGRLYKVRDGQGHTTQADWTPDKTPAMWAVVDVEHAGTVEDPIPAARGMDYIYGKYYLDPEDGKIYLCKRIGEEDGGVINLQYLPHELVDQYFTDTTEPEPEPEPEEPTET